MQYCSWCGQQLTGASAIVPGMQQPPYPQPQQPYPPPYQQPQQPYPQPYQQPYQQPYPPPANYQYPPTQPLNQQPYQQAPPQQVYVQPPQMNFAMAPPPVVVINRPTKSVFVAFLLTFFFGPLGMFYSTVGGAIVMLLASIVLNVAFYSFVYPRLYLESGFNSDFDMANLSLAACALPALIWLVSIIWGCAAAAAFNNRNQATIVR
jgi:hypothetical protein